MSLTTIHIRVLGDWSRKLFDNVSLSCQKEGVACEDGGYVELDVRVEGPYGSLSLNIYDPDYKVMVFISGGIGITPLQSLYKHLIHQQKIGKLQLRKVVFIWSVKDKAMIKSIGVHQSDDKSELPYLPLSFQPPMLPAPSIRSPKSRVDVEDNDDLSISSTLVFQSRYYLTSVRDEAEFLAAGINPKEQKNLSFGRPNIPETLNSIRQLCLDENLPHRVAVFTCGPQAMVNEVDDYCRASRLKCALQEVRFDCHKEVFNF
jgi:hypothetical protein